jgi:NAD(P)-dependent dehydrogenase (short-subunit alcohol dehydrogenase family)
MSVDRNLAGKVVLVVGGATGIGRSAARAFAARGAHLVFSDITDANGPALEKELRDLSLDALFVQSDATAEPEVAALVAQVVDLHGRLDAAINLVGAIPPPDNARARLHETSEAGWDGTVQLCLKSAFLCMKHQIAQMLQQGGGGAIVNTASLAALHVTPNGSPAYHAAKAGVIQLTRKAAVEYAADGVRVNVVAPGLTATDTLLSRWNAEQLKTMSAEQPIGRPVSPEEVAAAFVWLCSPEASGVTGLTLPVDGGWNAR